MIEEIEEDLSTSNNPPVTKGRRRNSDEASDDIPEHVAARSEGVLGLTEAEDKRFMQENTDIWLVGDSIPYWAGKQENQQEKSTNDFMAKQSPGGV